jgi:uncharacterized protein (DUF4415 family)
MKTRKPVLGDDGEVRELTKADIAGMVGFDELPQSLKRAIGQRGPQKAPTKVPVTIRLSPEVVQSFKSGGAGWQSRIDDTLLAHVKRNPVSSHIALKRKPALKASARKDVPASPAMARAKRA